MTVRLQLQFERAERGTRFLRGNTPVAHALPPQSLAALEEGPVDCFCEDTPQGLMVRRLLPSGDQRCRIEDFLRE